MYVMCGYARVCAASVRPNITLWRCRATVCFVASWHPQSEAQVLSDLKGIPFLKEEDYLLLCKEMSCPGGLLCMRDDAR